VRSKIAVASAVRERARTDNSTDNPSVSNHGGK
jgi:N-acetylglucosaminyl-diphospho-decaprenol L-rhamnosyltransferase